MVINVHTDREVPPLPPHVTLKQAKALMSTLLEGDPREHGVIAGTAKQLLSAILPKHEHES